jgi:hypothetical protein
VAGGEGGGGGEGAEEKEAEGEEKKGGQDIDESMDVIVLRRIGCHYNPVWVDGRPSTRLGELSGAFREHFGLY